jgi:imidazole glycerol-phosphate synthase subunit HisH
METVALIDYGSGNIRSAEKALWAAASQANRRREIRVTSDPDFVARADRIVLPGVGAFADCMAGLEAVPGLKEAMVEAVRGRGVRFLGICVGMQLMAQAGVEFGRHPGLGWISGEVRALTPSDPALKIPHMGWNTLSPARHPICAAAWGQGATPDVYFVHSYAFSGTDPDEVVATCDYGGPIPAIVARDNLFGVQFHPEKSQGVGLALLAAWLA